jgi:hypothetical protein
VYRLHISNILGGGRVGLGRKPRKQARRIRQIALFPTPRIT